MKSSANAEDFENLVRNGLDFLEKTISQLAAEPKHSVINFYTAVEIFLKAPLVLDHWSLVIANGDRNREKYESGDFVSVSFEESCRLLASALQKGLKQEAKDAFDKVRKHRNRMVHFFHNASTPKEKEAIRLEQAEAWFELNKFVTQDFAKAFAPFVDQFHRMERRLSVTEHYAGVKFASLKHKLNGMTKGGTIFEECSRCHQRSSELRTLDPDMPELTHRYCHVCLQEGTQLAIECPHCGDSDQILEPASTFQCDECGHRVPEGEKIYELLDQSQYGPDDYFEADTPANCDECQGYHTICEYKGKYLCTSCFSPFEQLYRCGYCNDPCTDEREESYFSGCEHCDGYVPADD